MKDKILLTGASGFVGSRVKSFLSRDSLVLVGRKDIDKNYRFFYSDMDNSSIYGEALDDVGCIIHCAAKAHVMDFTAGQTDDDYYKINRDGTLNLARQAAARGVKRFIFISSIKVNGEATQLNKYFSVEDVPAPNDAYGMSKLAAEIGLRTISEQTGMEIVIIRPPLIYGPGVKANFSALLNLAKRNYPLPLGLIKNKRSMVYLDNLVDLISICVYHPRAANQTFLVSDDQDVSTTELLEMMTRAADKSPCLLPVPASWLKFLGKLTGKQAVIERLCGNLQVDISHTKKTLDWLPPYKVEEGIRRCYVEGN